MIQKQGKLMMRMREK